MALEKVARFRLYEDELRQIEKRASERGQTLSDFLRVGAGLSPRDAAPPRPAKKSSGSSATAKRKAPAKSDSKKKKVDEDAEPGNAAIEELTARLRNREGLATPAARKKARDMLGSGG